MIQQSRLFFFRLNGDRNGGAWCSASPVSRELGTKEWIEVDLGSMHCITGIMTQGRFGNGRGVEYTEAYKLNYWRPGMTDFVEYHDNIGRSVGLHHAFGLFMMKIAFSWISFWTFYVVYTQKSVAHSVENARNHSHHLFRNKLTHLCSTENYIV